MTIMEYYDYYTNSLVDAVVFGRGVTPRPYKTRSRVFRRRKKTREVVVVIY
jgi:hypothetical protein